MKHLLTNLLKLPLIVRYLPRYVHRGTLDRWFNKLEPLTDRSWTNVMRTCWRGVPNSFALAQQIVALRSDGQYMNVCMKIEGEHTRSTSAAQLAELIAVHEDQGIFTLNSYLRCRCSATNTCLYHTYSMGHWAIAPGRNTLQVVTDAPEHKWVEVHGSPENAVSVAGAYTR